MSSPEPGTPNRDSSEIDDQDCEIECGEAGQEIALSTIHGVVTMSHGLLAKTL